MLRMKYKLPTSGENKGKTPHAKIRELFPGIQMKLGRFCQMESGEKWRYGEVNLTETADKSSVISACSDWGMIEFATTQDALNFADAAGDAPGTVVSPKVTMNAASLVNNEVTKTTTEDWGT